MLLRQESVVAYLRDLGVLPASDARVTPLGGGVSNVVLRVQGAGLDIVVKQALPMLRVEEEWLASVERLRAEVACLQFLSAHLPPGSVPDLVFYDRARFAYGMTMVPDHFRTWKEELLGGRIRLAVAERVGRLLGEIHGLTWERRRIGDTFDDLEPFHQLRVDPYYRTVADRHAEVSGQIRDLIGLMEANRRSLVHGDYSPKNILVDGGRPVLLDYEVAHYGDPAFDTGFLVNHLFLKAVHVPGARPALRDAVRAFWAGYGQALGSHLGPLPADLEARTVRHLGALQLARIDGKSPAEYVRAPAEKDTVRQLGKRLLTEGPARLEDALGLLPE